MWVVLGVIVAVIVARYLHRKKKQMSDRPNEVTNVQVEIVE